MSITMLLTCMFQSCLNADAACMRYNESMRTHHVA